MTKKDFLEILGDETTQSRPYHANLPDLLVVSSVEKTIKTHDPSDKIILSAAS